MKELLCVFKHRTVRQLATKTKYRNILCLIYITDQVRMTSGCNVSYKQLQFKLNKVNITSSQFSSKPN